MGRMPLLPCNILLEIFASGLSISEICYIFCFFSGRGKCVYSESLGASCHYAMIADQQY